MMTLEYYINKDERGEFNADVRTPNGDTILEFEADIFEDGWIKHKDDLNGIMDYLSYMGYDISKMEIVKAN